MKSTITEGGQVSIPAELRLAMQLTPGKTVVWEKISTTECRLLVERRPPAKADPVAAIGFAKRHGLPEGNTADWMRMLREDES